MHDKIVGRPIRLNRQSIPVKKGKKYAEVMFIGDIHFGSPQCDVEKFKSMLDYCGKTKTPIYLMGDLVEMATRDSVGSGIYEQEFIGEDQVEQMIGILKPLAQKKLLLGFLNGNHEDRIYKATGVNISKGMCRELGIPYLGDACWNSLKVGDQNYSLYLLHGRTGARYDGTALLALERISVSFHCDIVAMGHAHKTISSIVQMQTIKHGQVVEHKKHLIITGSYLKYDGSYAQTAGLPISKLGSPKVKFFIDRHDINLSW